MLRNYNKKAVRSYFKAAKTAKNYRIGFRAAEAALLAADKSGSFAAKHAAKKLVSVYEKIFKFEKVLNKSHSRRTKQNARKALAKAEKELRHVLKSF